MKKPETHGSSEHEGKYWGKGKFANMPTDVKMDEYPKSRLDSDYEDDTINRIDRENNEMQDKRKRYVSGQH